jgi:hypothetical protein
VTRVRQGLELPRGYAYADRPPREEILEEVRGADGKVVAVITRNSYGSRVLNTGRTMFVDIDLPAERGGDRLRAWFGLKRDSAEADTLRQMKPVLEAIGGGSFRIYRTAAGYRVLATDPAFAPGSADAEKLMTDLTADPAFIQLCRAQESFRARLTPKPWRCGWTRSTVGYPREGPESEEAFAEWLAGYERACASKATCRLVEEIGRREVHPEARRIVEVHDHLTRATSGLPLA